MSGSKMLPPVFAEDSNLIDLAPILSETIEELGESDNKFDFIMAFFITLMAESGYRVSCLYDENNEYAKSYCVIPVDYARLVCSFKPKFLCFSSWSNKMTCIPSSWKPPGKNIYEIDFVLYKRVSVGCKLIGIPIGDWIILNLLAKGASNRCKTRSITVNVPKHVNVYKKELNQFWHLKELALR